MSTMTKAQRTERDESIERLIEEMPVGSTVYTVLRHVSRSGMQRAISVHVIEGGKVYDWSYRASKVLGWSLHRSEQGLKVDGCGMDMGFHLVYSLSQVLHGDGYALNHRWI
jgi:hypothetical protein